MPLITLGKWKIDADPQATRQAYIRQRQGSPYDCTCIHCRNFEAARDRIYTDDVLRVLEPLGVEPPIREAEICHYYGPLDSGLHLYGGWLHVVGRLVDGVDAKRMVSPTAWTFDLEEINERFSIGATAYCALIPEAFRDLPIVQLEFEFKVPWILSEPWE